jgi:hypothetical protein
VTLDLLLYRLVPSLAVIFSVCFLWACLTWIYSGAWWLWTEGRSRLAMRTMRYALLVAAITGAGMLAWGVAAWAGSVLGATGAIPK